MVSRVDEAACSVGVEVNSAVHARRENHSSASGAKTLAEMPVLRDSHHRPSTHHFHAFCFLSQ